MPELLFRTPQGFQLVITSPAPLQGGWTERVREFFEELAVSQLTGPLREEAHHGGRAAEPDPEATPPGSPVAVSAASASSATDSWTSTGSVPFSSLPLARPTIIGGSSWPVRFRLVQEAAFQDRQHAYGSEWVPVSARSEGIQLRWYDISRDRLGRLYDPSKLVRSWAECFELVRAAPGDERRLSSGTVFRGFHCEYEREAYLEAFNFNW